MALSSRSSTRRSSKDARSSEQVVEEQIVQPNGEFKVQRYSKGRFLGKGGFARVYEFTNLETRRLYAAKVVAKSSLTRSRAKQKLMSEIKIHRSLKNSNIVSFEHFFEDSENVYILLELCPNQTMNELLRRRKRLTELEVQCYSLQIISSLKYIHNRRVIHRDLKIGNLFISDKMEIKLGDFGLATKLEFEGQKRRTICGTPNYIAPEVLDGKCGHSFEVDIWSLGVIMYTLLVGKPPFETNDVKKTYNLIKMTAYSFPDHVPVSNEAKSLITRILKSDPSRRPSLDEILQHEFFHMGNGIPKLLPVSTLAVPPSEGYLNKFLQKPVPRPEYPTADTAPVQQHQVTRLKQTRDLVGTQKVQRSPRSPKSQEGAKVWVKKWVDYSSKYGMGYILSNGCSGVYFNDSTKIIVEPNASVFYFIERTTDKRDMVFSYSLEDYPKSLYKKVTLLQHFKSYLEMEIDTYNPCESCYSIENPPPYVKRWLKSRRAILFRLSNMVVQVSFQDNTEVILTSENKMMTYINKKSERITMPLSEALESSNTEMTKRLKYTRDILNYMTSGQILNGGAGSPTINHA